MSTIDSVENLLLHGDCLLELDRIPDSSVDMIYLDPPFFTQRVHSMTTANGVVEFDDRWEDEKHYLQFLRERLMKLRLKLKSTGSLFFHCDRTASHHIRFLLDEIFGVKNFQSEIIWRFRRWSNSKRGLLNAHQNIYFYSRSRAYKFNQIFDGYSPTTNVDQILQKRTRDWRNKSVYELDTDGKAVRGVAKKGVPISDVWDIPLLNPKAKERVGYPTQKPVHLVSRIIEIACDPDDIVLDPFCGSGTTLVAAKQLNRKWIGIDSSKQAVEISLARLKKSHVSESMVLNKGRSSFLNQNLTAQTVLHNLDYTPIQRNSGIDGYIDAKDANDIPTFIRVQREHENFTETVEKIRRATQSKGDCKLLVVQTTGQLPASQDFQGIIIVPSFSLSVLTALRE